MLNLAVLRRPNWSACRARVVVCSKTNMAPKEKRAGQPRSAHYSSHIMVLNVDNATAAPSVLLFFDKDRYLFNAGEGIQRHFIEQKRRLKKVTHVLATRVSTDTLGGLPGMLLSQVEPGADLGRGGGATVNTCVTGPPGLSQYVDAFRMYTHGFSLSVNDLGSTSSPSISSAGRVSINPVLLTPAAGSSKLKPAHDATAGAAAEQADGSCEPAAKKARHDGPAAGAPGSQEETATTAQGTNSRGMASVHSTSGMQPPVACYVCQLASIPGKFDPQKAAQLGVPRGPLYGELQRGNAVTAVNGRTVEPHQVMDTPTMPGACVIIIDCPSLDYLEVLKQDSTLQQLQQETYQQQQQQSGADQPASSTGAPAASEDGQGSSSSTAEGPVRKRFVLVHLGPSAVSRSAAYTAWCDGFGAGADQLFVSSDSQGCSTTRKAALLQAQLNVIEPKVFSLQGLRPLNQAAAQEQQQAVQQQSMSDAAGVAGAAGDGSGGASAAAATAAGSTGAASDGVRHSCADGVVFKLAPARSQGLCLSAVARPTDIEAVQAEVRDHHPKVMELLQEYVQGKAAVLRQGQQQPVPELQGVDAQTCAVVPLGTCSACPSTHRNVSAYYMDLFKRGGLLMDCGEDTLGQLERRYGRAEADRRIQELHAVWISHMHADHHGGLYPLLLRRQALLQQRSTASNAVAGTAAQGVSDTADGRDQAAGSGAAPLLVLGPFPLFRVLCQYSKVLPLSFTFLPNHYFFSPAARQPPAEALAAYEAAKAAAGLAVLQPFPVQHVSNSSGLQVQASSGWKVVFSGDTRPCQAVIDAAKDATLLVHEATFDNELQDEAVAKKHSTTAEALGVAAAANAYRTLLTHFSTRYPRIPVMKPPACTAEEATAADAEADGSGGGSDLAALGSVLVAFDLMTVNLADLPWLPKMLPVLDELFKEEEEVYRDGDDEGGEGAE